MEFENTGFAANALGKLHGRRLRNSVLPAGLHEEHDEMGLTVIDKRQPIGSTTRA